MFHGRPLNQSGVFQSQPQPQQQTPSWPLSQQDHNNLRASQSGTTPSVQVKFYLPDDEIRRSQISTNCTLQQVTEQIKRYASVADKDLLLAWNDDQNEWIRFDTDSEFNDAMNHARHLLAQSGVFKIQAKEGKTPKKQQPTTSSPVVVEQNPIQQQPPVVTQPPVQQPVQPPVIQRPPVTQSPIHQPPVTTQPPVTQPPVQPIVQRPPVTQPTNPFYPQPVQPQPPMMAYGTSPFQPQFTPMTMMAQPSGNMPVPRNASPFTATTTTTPTKTLTNSVTMQQPHPLNASFGSPNVVSPIQPSVTQSPVQQPPQTQQPQVDQNSLATLRSFGFPVHDSVLIKALQDANGDINVAAGKLLENN